ncbi:MAG: tetraacyldisaccharide 4'-kinase [Prolixibacteraceae bacterium]|nr:tetraacyldisaccharide 4'-kinase [Prolixibacteraceae bacterium]
MKKFFLYIFSLVYGMAVNLRNTLFNLNILRTREFEVPVISVGNITVGGTGKTPHTEHLIGLLSKKFDIAVLSRGYKRKSKGFMLVEAGSTIRQSGDEPLQIKRKFPGVMVAVDENRVRGIEKILAISEKRPDVIILDDAFQHRYVTPSINILLIDFSRMITEDTLLPYGRLREPASNRDRANIIIVTKCPREIKPIDERIITKDLHIWPYQDLFFSRIKYGEMLPLFPDKVKEKKVCLDANTGILLLTGIANSHPLRDRLLQTTKSVVSAEYPDHYPFTLKDMEKVAGQLEAMTAEKKIIVTTEKDTLRILEIENIPETIAENLYYIPIEIRFINQTDNDFDKKIMKYVGENKSNFELHSRKNKI